MTSAELTATGTGDPAVALGSTVASMVGDALLWPRAGAVLSPAERAWDRFVEAHPGGDVVQTAAWAQSKHATGFAVAIAVSRDAGGEIAGGGLVIARRVALAGGRLPVATVGYVARGPLVTRTDAATIDRVLDAIEAAARRLGVMHLIVQPPKDGVALAARLEQRGYDGGAMAVAPTATLEIDLTPDLDSLFARMSASQRRNLRKAQKLGVRVRRATDADLPTFHALQEATAARQGYQPLSLAYLQAQWQALRPLGAVEIFLASTPDAPERPIAGSLLTAYAGTVTDKIPGWTGEAAALQPNVACSWEAITWAKTEGFRTFDLGGVPRDAAVALLAGDRTKEAHGERNPAAFKARFGGSVVMLPEALQRTFNPVLRPAVRFAWRQLVTSPRLKSFVNGLRNG
jgi:lipid II:glycine glycyltransferase (peptidoglycan interpeptide bridge formation enzyme)